MTTITRSAQEKKELIKECVIELLNEKDLLSALTKKIIDEVEKVFSEKTALLDKKICELQVENKLLSEKCESLEQYSRRNNVRIFGLPTTQQNHTEEQVITLFKEKMGVNIGPEVIDRCHPVGPVKNGKQAIIVKFMSYKFRRQVLAQRKVLKGSGIGVAEDLTFTRYLLYKKVMDKFGYKNVWLFDGNINVKLGDSKHIFRNLTDFDKFLATKS